MLVQPVRQAGPGAPRCRRAVWLCLAAPTPTSTGKCLSHAPLPTTQRCNALRAPPACLPACLPACWACLALPGSTCLPAYLPACLPPCLVSLPQMPWQRRLNCGGCSTGNPNSNECDVAESCIAGVCTCQDNGFFYYSRKHCGACNSPCPSWASCGDAPLGMRHVCGECALCPLHVVTTQTRGCCSDFAFGCHLQCVQPPSALARLCAPAAPACARSAMAPASTCAMTWNPPQPTVGRAAFAALRAQCAATAAAVSGVDERGGGVLVARAS